jgi:ABC-type enterobactin transport system permease subunit
LLLVNLIFLCLVIAMAAMALLSGRYPIDMAQALAILLGQGGG